MLNALTLLLTLQLLGEMAVRWLGWPIPGPVLGMAGLWLLLVCRPRTLTLLRPTAQGLLQHLSLLFVPAGVGVTLHLQRLGDELWAIGLALVLSTWIGLAVAAWTAIALMRWTGTDDTPSPPQP